MDERYWNTYYKNKLPPVEPSQFAVDMLPHMVKGGRLLDLGCGNGRDSIFFANNGLEVVGIDQAGEAIAQLNTAGHSAHFVQDDFVTSSYISQSHFDYVYSRFTLHAISLQQEAQVLQSIFTALNPAGKLFIEVRSINDELYGQGECVEHNAYLFDGHYRRFIVLEEMLQALQGLGFTIVQAQQQRGFAAYRQENPIVIRIIAQKSEPLS